MSNVKTHRKAVSTRHTLKQNHPVRGCQVPKQLVPFSYNPVPGAARPKYHYGTCFRRPPLMNMRMKAHFLLKKLPGLGLDKPGTILKIFISSRQYILSYEVRSKSHSR